jgi:hypothetical protein
MLRFSVFLNTMDGILPECRFHVNRKLLFIIVKLCIYTFFKIPAPLAPNPLIPEHSSPSCQPFRLDEHCCLVFDDLFPRLPTSPAGYLEIALILSLQDDFKRVEELECLVSGIWRGGSQPEWLELKDGKKPPMAVFWW